MPKQKADWSWEEKYEPPNPKRRITGSKLVFFWFHITVQKPKLFVPRQNMDVQEQEKMKCNYEVLALVPKITFKPSRLVFAALQFVLEQIIDHIIQKYNKC